MTSCIGAYTWADGKQQRHIILDDEAVRQGHYVAVCGLDPLQGWQNMNTHTFEYLRSSGYCEVCWHGASGLQPKG